MSQSENVELSMDNIPPHHRANRPGWVRKLGLWLYRRSGWRIVGHFPDDNLLVVAVAPHTSNWDFVVGVMVMLALDLKANILMKQDAFIPVLKGFYQWIGVIAVNRSNPAGFVEQTAQLLQNKGTAMLVVTPEGTRSKVVRWKTGFIRIARACNARLIAIAPDYKDKIIYLGEAFEPHGDVDEQLRAVQAYASQVTPKHPEKF